MAQSHARVVLFDRTTPPHIATLVALAGVSALNMNVFLPSLPSMAAWFSVDYAVVQLAISAYLAMTALLQIIIGPLSDRFGRRPVLLWSFGLFLLATLGVLVAPDFITFMAFRLLQGAIVSGMVLSRAIVRDMVPPEQAASMIGYVTMGMSLVPMLAPMLGGVLDAQFGWQAGFVLILLAGLATFALLWADLGETNTRKSTSFGAQFRAYPQLIRSRRFWGYTGTASLASGAFFSFLGGAPFVGSQVLGLSPTMLGVWFGAISLGYTLGNFISGRWSAQVGLNKMMLRGCLIAFSGTALALGLLILGVQSALGVFGPMFAVGLGNGMTLPNANAGIVSVRPSLAGSASGLGGALMIGGGAALAAVTGGLMTPQSGAWPLVMMMCAVSGLAVLCSLYVIAVARRAPPLGAEGFSD